MNGGFFEILSSFDISGLSLLFAFWFRCIGGRLCVFPRARNGLGMLGSVLVTSVVSVWCLGWR
jgi:hypothetical protein